MTKSEYFQVKRGIYKDLVAWKLSDRRKPLLLRGARQTGKTYILKEFGLNEYNRVHYFNFEEDPLLTQFFERDLNPSRIIADLSIYHKTTIKPQEDLVIFDEIQVSNKALNSLKYFEEDLNDFHVAAAGSLLGVKLSSPGTFPVGKVNFLDIYPMTFLEFLEAMGESEYRRLLEGIEGLTPLIEPFHKDLINLLRTYYFVGGMPEVVKYYVETKNVCEARVIQKEIIESYVLDFAKHAPSSDIPKLSLIWESIPGYLAKENKKFIFSALKKGARAREYENALIWLDGAGLIHRVNAVEVGKLPLKSYAQQSCFKIYCLDVGLLGALAKVPEDIILHGDQLFNEYEGSFVENYVAQQLAPDLDKDLYYWRSKGGRAEVDFLCEVEGEIYPLEVKAGINPRSKSLNSYDTQFSPAKLIRTTLLNLKQNGKFINIPLYAISLFVRLRSLV